MMDFWSENQGHSHLYSKFGTVPGRNCTHNYHDRHQSSHYPLYYGEQQDQSRDSSYWTLPGSRTAGVLHEYTNWTDPEMSAPSSSHFPFILDRHPQHHQDLGDYQPQEARDREWTPAHRAPRDYDRGFPREGWQRRWEPCSPVLYNREVPAKRSDSSYRELEAWAARYSHSLPRRRRIEAELRGASQGLVESSRAPERDRRTGTDPQVAALQHVQQSASIRRSGLWDREGRQHAPAYYPSQAPAPDANHTLDMKENAGYQRRTFSQPPGYIPPPPYNSPHKSSHVMHRDTSWEPERKRQTYWSQSMPRKRDVPVDVQDQQKTGKQLTKPGESKTCTEVEWLKHRRQAADALQAGSPISVQNTRHAQHEGMPSLQHPQAVQHPRILQETSSKVIEGRKFRLNKKTGGMTIFCLVSRIAGTTETPSLPLYTSQANIQRTETGAVPEGVGDRGEVSETHKLADEVDFRAPTLAEPSHTSDVRNIAGKQKETPVCTEKEIPADNLPDKAETDDVSPEKENTSDADSAVHPVSVRYPLWRQPSFTSKPETETSSTCCLKVNGDEDESEQNGHDSADVSSEPMDIEVRLDVEEDTEDSKGLLVIDTACVVVKMELIPSPKKQHVHYLDSTAQDEDSALNIQTSDLNCQVNQDVTTEQNAVVIPLTNESPQSDLDSGLLEKEEDEEESEISLPCMSSSPVSERETLEERAERILGISLKDCVTEQQPEDVTSFLDSCIEDEEADAPPVENEIHDAIKQTPEESTEEERSQNLSEVVQAEDAVCSADGDQVTREDGEDFAGSQQPDMSEANDVYQELESDTETLNATETTEDPLLESSGEKGTSEPSDLCNTSSLSASDLTPTSYISESNLEEGPDPELAALNTVANLAPHPETSSLPQTPPPPPPPPLDLVDPLFGAEDQDIRSETSHQIENEVDIESPDMTEEALPQQQLDCEQPDDAACVAEKQQTEEAEKQQTEEAEKQQIEAEKQQTEEAEKQQTEEAEKQQIEAEKQQTEEAEKQQTEEAEKQQTEEAEKQQTEAEKQQTEAEKQQTEEAEKQQTEEAEKQQTEEAEKQQTEEAEKQQTEEAEKQQTEAEKQQTEAEKQQTEEAEKQQTEEAEKQQTEEAEKQQIEAEKQQIEAEKQQIEAEKQQIEAEKQQTEEAEKQQIEAEKQQIEAEKQQIEAEKQQTEEAEKQQIEAEKQQTEEADEQPARLLEQTPETSKENAKDVDIVQQQLEVVRSEDDVTEELQPIEVSEDPTEPSIHTSVDKLFHQDFDYDQEQHAFCTKESYMTEDQSQNPPDELPAGLWEEIINNNNATDSQTQIKTDILQDAEASDSPPPSASACEASQSPLELLSPPHESDTAPLLDTCPSPLNPDIPRVVPPPLFLDPCEEPLRFSSSSPSDSPPLLPPSSTPPPREESVSPDFPPSAALKAEPQYPESLWDVVNRIRKHTAPDSENEEEEVGELWDPENGGEDSGCLDVGEDVNSDGMVFVDAEQEDVSKDSVETGQMQQQHHEESSGHADEDTLSCSSISSHNSGDTVIVADEDEEEETTLDDVTDDVNEEVIGAEGDLYCSAEVKDESATEGNEEEEEEEEEEDGN